MLCLHLKWLGFRLGFDICLTLYPEVRFLAMHSVFPVSQCVFQCSQYSLQGTGGTIMKNIIQTGIRCGSVGGFIFQNACIKRAALVLILVSKALGITLPVFVA